MQPAEREAVTSRCANKCNRRTSSSPAKAIIHRLARVGVLARILTAVSAVLWSGVGGLWASPASGPHKSTVRRSPRTLPSRFILEPEAIALLAADQSQRFDVADSKGRRVPVRWSLSGPGCSGLTCGAVDGKGTYRAPHSLERPMVVVLRGAPLSDPTRSVSTQIWLAPAAPAADPVRDRAAAAPSNTDAPTGRRPVVTFQNGQLTIDAENATLAAVLQLVAQKTGVEIDVPVGSGLERIVEHAGPGQARDVLAHLLNGSHFNFVILSSPQYPYGPQQVLLSLRGGSEAPNAISASAPPKASDVPPPDACDSAETAFPRPVVTASTTPKEQVPPEVIEQMMKDKAREIRESAQQESAPQPTSQEESVQKQ